MAECKEALCSKDDLIPEEALTISCSGDLQGKDLVSMGLPSQFVLEELLEISNIIQVSE